MESIHFKCQNISMEDREYKTYRLNSLVRYVDDNLYANTVYNPGECG